MSDEAQANEANLDDEGFTEAEQAMLRGEEPAEIAEEAVEEAVGGDGAEQPLDAQGQPATPAEAGAEAERQGSIPSWRLREETEKRRAVETRYQEMAEQKARVDERLNILLQWAQNESEAAKQAKQTPPPNKAEDPLGYLEWQNQQLQQHLGQYNQRFQQYDQHLQQQHQAQAQQQQRQQVWDAYNNDVAAYSAENPDFNDALNYLGGVRAAELQAMGFQGPQINRQIAIDLEQFVTVAMQNGIRPAEALYTLAKARLPQQQAPAGNGAAGGQQQQAQQAKPGQKLQNIAKGQAVNKSLSGSGSGSPQPVDAAIIAGMDDEEFAGWYAQNFSDKKLQKMMGY